MRTVRRMNKNTTNRTCAHRRPAPAQQNAPDLATVFPDVDQAARALMRALASAVASDFDEARRLRCTDLLLVTTNVVTSSVGS